MLTPETGLPHRIRKERLRRKAKQPFQPGLFVRVACLVEKYGLGDDFLDMMDEFTRNFAAEDLKGGTVTAKEKLPLPLFYLASPEKYRLAMAIIEKINHPYLNFANSPEEILLCRALARSHPDLEPERLAACHFRTLLSGDAVGQKMQR